MPIPSFPRRRPGFPPVSRRLILAALAVPILAPTLGAAAIDAARPDDTETDQQDATTESAVQLLADDRSLDGSGNNLGDPALGQADVVYTRVTAANYLDGVGEPVEGPNERYLSNRIFNDTNQNVFSENDTTHWSFVWGQFIDHTISLREGGDEDLVVPFDPTDPLEDFTNDLGVVSTTRSAAADGTGVDTTREQVNTVSSYIDGWAVYGGSAERLDWLREGSLDGDPTNNDATLLNADGYLPTVADRPDADAPAMDVIGRLFADPTQAVVAGDVRANENIGLTAVHTLFMREHNRIVDSLPDDLDEETKFTIARRVVAALQQHITYNEFLPAMGVDLDDYAGYDPTVDPTITNEFATVGYRAHSQVHGEFEAELDPDDVTEEQLDALRSAGVSVEADDDAVELAVPLSVAFGNPGLLSGIGLGNLLAGLGSEAAYANDEQIDNQLRSVLFQIPGPEVENPLDCLDGSAIAECFTAVNDLGALDVLRAGDHGMPSYNDMREAYGLDPVETFTALTGESTADLPDGMTVDDPAILEFTLLTDADGNVLEPGSDAAEASTVTAIRASTTAARLQSIFADVDAVDAFTGMVSEPHVAGTEFGELQLAMWTQQFQALRDGDRFFYENDPALDAIAAEYGIDINRTLADVILANSDANPDDVPDNVFQLDEDSAGTEEADDDADDDTGTQASSAQGDEERSDDRRGNGRRRGRGTGPNDAAGEGEAAERPRRRGGD